MAVRCWPGAGRRGATSSQSATNVLYATRNWDSRSVAGSSLQPPGFRFPKSVRILRRSDFRRVYDDGTRYSCPYFAAFCLAREQNDGPKIGFTVSRASGHSVVRNRMKRRMREVVRLHLRDLPPKWAVVFNPRKPLLEADLPL